MLKSFIRTFFVFALLALQVNSISANQNPNNTDIVGNSIADLNKQCWACPVVGSFYDMSVYFGSGASQIVGSAFKTALAVLLALWIIYQVIKLSLPLGESDGARKSWGQFAKRTGIVVIVFLILSNPSWVWEWLIEPSYSIGISVSQTIQSTVFDTNQTDLSDVGNSLFKLISNVQQGNFNWGDLFNLGQGIFNLGKTQCQASNEYNAKLNSVLQSAINFFKNPDTVGDFEDNRNMLICQIQNVQSLFSSAMVAGNAAMVNSTQVEAVKQQQNSRYYAGFALLVIGALIIIVYPLFMLEALFKIMVVGMLSPFFIASFLFPTLQKFGISALKTLVQSILTIVLLSTIVSVGIAVIANIGKYFGTKSVLSILLESSEKIPGEYTVAGLGVVDISLTNGFFWTVFIGLLVLFIMLTKASAIASMLSGTQDTGGAAQIASQAASMSTSRIGMSGGK